MSANKEISYLPLRPAVLWSVQGSARYIPPWRLLKARRTSRNQRPLSKKIVNIFFSAGTWSCLSDANLFRRTELKAFFLVHIIRTSKVVLPRPSSVLLVWLLLPRIPFAYDMEGQAAERPQSEFAGLVHQNGEHSRKSASMVPSIFHALRSAQIDGAWNRMWAKHPDDFC